MKASNGKGLWDLTQFISYLINPSIIFPLNELIKIWSVGCKDYSLMSQEKIVVSVVNELLSLFSNMAATKNIDAAVYDSDHTPLFGRIETVLKLFSQPSK
jgi:hypothetical protein